MHSVDVRSSWNADSAVVQNNVWTMDKNVPVSILYWIGAGYSKLKDISGEVSFTNTTISQSEYRI
ncbi:MAG: hypothetical protein JRN15_01625 [Nitrososphaerota archaeon]|nr:hypothetical protein [Nitrososphaerota archaeon]